MDDDGPTTNTSNLPFEPMTLEKIKAIWDEFRGQMMVDYGLVPCAECNKFIAHNEMHICRPLFLGPRYRVIRLAD